MQWIRDGLKLIDDAGASEALAEQTGDDLSVYLVPAFTGLGAPYWDPDARGALLGMTRDTGINEVVTAGFARAIRRKIWLRLSQRMAHNSQRCV